MAAALCDSIRNYLPLSATLRRKPMAYESAVTQISGIYSQERKIRVDPHHPRVIPDASSDAKESAMPYKINHN